MSGLEQRSGQIHRGFGVVIRWPDVAAVIPSHPDHDAIIDAMIEELGPDPQAADLVASVDRLLADEQLLAIGLVVEAEDGPLAMAYGAVEILADGEAVITGESGLARHRLPPAAHRLTIRSLEFDNALEPVAPYDLRRGVAPGAGLTLLQLDRAATAAPAAGSPAPPAEIERAVDPHLGQVTTDEGIPATAPEPPQPPSPSRVAQPMAGPAELDLDADHPDEVSAVDPDDPDTDLGLAANGPGPDSPADPRTESRASSRDATPDAAGNDGEPPSFFSGDAESGPGSDGPNGVAPGSDVPFRSVVLADGPAPDPTEPLPTAQAETTGQVGRFRVDAGRVEVEGILCPRGHFNNPTAQVCMVCGLPIAHLRDERVFGPRPTLGFMVFDDGTTYGLDRSYVIGREPRLPEGSEADSLIVRTDNETLSRTHAELRLEGWAVTLIDLGSTNGTYVWDVAAERWNRLDPGAAVELASGDTVAVGRRTFVFEGVGRG